MATTSPTLDVAVRGEVVDTAPVLAAEAQVKEALREGKTALWKLAEALWAFNEQKGWAALGYENLTRWLENPDIDMTRGTYYRLVGTWQKLAVDKGLKRDQLEGVDMSKAALVADTIVDGTHRPSTVLKDVKALPASALREKYGMPRRGRPPKGEASTVSPSASRAIAAARDLPWDWVDQAVHGRAPIALRQARLKEALTVLLAWRDEFLVEG